LLECFTNPLMGALKLHSNGPLCNNRIGPYSDWVHWPSMGWLLHLVQRGTAWVGWDPAQFPPHSLYQI